MYFATRYRRIDRLLGRNVHFKVGPLFEFPELVNEWKRKPKTTLNRSVARAALQLKFTLELEVTSEDGDITKSTSQLLWRFNPNTVAAEFAPDWERLTQHPVVYCSAHREPISGKGRLQSVDLSNVKTFVAAFDKDRGSFVSAYRKENNIIVQWTANLNAASELNLLSEQDAAAVQSRFDAFVASYGRAIKAFTPRGCHTLVGTNRSKHTEHYWTSSTTKRKVTSHASFS